MRLGSFAILLDGCGRLTVNGATLDFTCPNSTIPIVRCNSNTVTIESAAKVDAMYRVRVSAGIGSFDGPISPRFTTVDDFNGPGCGTCTSGRATVELQ